MMRTRRESAPPAPARQAGELPGFWRELEHAMRLVPRQRIVMLIPFGSVDHDRFAELVRSRTGLALPPFEGSKVPGSSIHAVLWFDHSGACRIQPIRSSLADWLVLLSVLSPVVRTKQQLRRVPALTRAIERAVPMLAQRSGTVRNG
jgi:hypothetical protein